MTNQDKFISNLVRLYRGGYRNRAIDLMTFCQRNGADYTEIESFAARLKAEGSAVEAFGRHSFKLTDPGFLKYSERVEVLDHTERGGVDFIYPDPASHD